MSARESLASRYRPQGFEEVVGQRLTAAVLQQMVRSGEVPSGLLFSGPSGSGKTTAARILASALTDNNSMSYTEIDAASNGGVEAVRNLTESLRYVASTRVVVYDEAQSMSRDAFNALLKTLEEPPEGVVFILATTEPEKIPETVKTRLMEFRFRRGTPADIFDRLVHVASAEAITVSQPLLQMLADRAEGNFRSALTLLDMVHRAGITTVEQFTDLSGEQDFAPRIVSAALAGDIAGVYAALDTVMMSVGDASVVATGIVRCLRDMLVLRSGGVLAVAGTSLEARRELSLRVGPDRVVAAMRMLWDIRTRMRAADDPKSNLELALALITDVFARGKSQAPAAPTVATPLPRAQTFFKAEMPSPDSKPLTVEEMRRLLGQ